MSPSACSASVSGSRCSLQCHLLGSRPGWRLDEPVRAPPTLATPYADNQGPARCVASHPSADRGCFGSIMVRHGVGTSAAGFVALRTRATRLETCLFEIVLRFRHSARWRSGRPIGWADRRRGASFLLVGALIASVLEVFDGSAFRRARRRGRFQRPRLGDGFAAALVQHDRDPHGLYAATALPRWSPTKRAQHWTHRTVRPGFADPAGGPSRLRSITVGGHPARNRPHCRCRQAPRSAARLSPSVPLSTGLSDSARSPGCRSAPPASASVRCRRLRRHRRLASRGRVPAERHQPERPRAGVGGEAVAVRPPRAAVPNAPPDWATIAAFIVIGAIGGRCRRRRLLTSRPDDMKGADDVRHGRKVLICTPKT